MQLKVTILIENYVKYRLLISEVTHVGRGGGRQAVQIVIVLCPIWDVRNRRAKPPEMPPYRKIPKMSRGGNIFERPFLRGLFLEGLIFGGVYLQREICVSKSIGLAL